MRNNKGITLVALVITIIAISILSAISLNVTLGENGVLTKAMKVESEYNKGEVLEELNIIITEKYLDAYGKATKDGKMNIKEHYDGNKVIDFLLGYESDENGNVNTEDESKRTLTHYIDKLNRGNNEVEPNEYFINLDTLRRSISKYGKGTNNKDNNDYFFIRTTIEGEGDNAQITKATVYYKNLQGTDEEIGDLQIQQSI